ncbi:MAG: MBOAT family protein, partial [Cyanobacteria bacterium J083]
MNYSDFSFWWVLILFSIPFFTVRYLGKYFNLWQGVFDSIGLMALSMLLFFNASASSFVVFALEIVFNYLMVQFMLRREGNQAKLIATAIILFDVGVLAYFKYLTFFVEDFLGLVVTIPANWQQSFPLPVFKTIPPGVSFYTFQMVSFVVDSLNLRK